MDGWQAGFEIGVQGFYLQPVAHKKGHPEDTEEKAKWYQGCLDTAFKKLSDQLAQVTNDMNTLGKMQSESMGWLVQKEKEAKVLVAALQEIFEIAKGCQDFYQPIEDVHKIAKLALSVFVSDGKPKDDPMELPEQYKTADPFKAAVYFGWYHGLVNAYTHNFTWEQYQKAYPHQSLPPENQASTIKQLDGLHKLLLDRLEKMTLASQQLFDGKKANPKDKKGVLSASWNKLAMVLFDAKVTVQTINETIRPISPNSEELKSEEVSIAQQEDTWNEAIEKYKEQTGSSVFATNLFKGWMKMNYNLTKK